MYINKKTLATCMSIISLPAHAQHTSLNTKVVPFPTAQIAANEKSTLSVVDFGAVGDGTTDNAGAFNRTVEAAYRIADAGNSVSIVVPSGRYKTSVPLTLHLSNRIGSNVSVYGEGASSVILPTGSNSAIDLEIDRGDVSFNISNIVASKSLGSKGGNAIEIHSNSGPIAHGYVSNIICNNLSDNLSKVPFYSCIHLRNVIRTEITGIKNLDAGAGNGDSTAGIGIWADGTDGLYTVDNHISDVQQNDGFAYVALTGHVEGMTIDALTGLGGAYGVYAPGRSWGMTTSGKDKARYPNNSLLWVTLTNSHINSYIRGFYAVSGNSIKIADDLFYNTMLGSGKNIIPISGDRSYLPLTTNLQGGMNTGGYSYIGVDILNSTWSHVTNNEVQCANAQASTGIAFQKISYDETNDTAENNFIYANVAMGSTAAGMSFGDGLTKSFIYNNIIDSQYWDGTQGNISYNNISTKK